MEITRLLIAMLLLAWGVIPTGEPAALRPPSPGADAGEPGGDAGRGSVAIAVPILLYHRFGQHAPDDMWVTDSTFAWQLQYLSDHGYTVIRLHALTDWLQGKGPPPPPRAVVIAADDGHRSVYSDMQPLIRRYHVPVTLFIYPSAISNASYAMTWSELDALMHSGLFEVESHTYWHPNFNRERARLTPSEYEAFVRMQLTRSKQALESRLAIHVDLLAWPFGIYDDDLMARAAEAGYTAAFSIERRPVTARDRLMALPRYIVTDADRGAAFARLLGERSAPDTRR